jgi:TetR/AcrR family transcriptional regulator, transcriptional repressor of bet genes
MRSYKARRPASGARQRQRQRLIDACISALHLHGPSRTTVERVVAIAKMSPGIVRFYFDSKAAMMVASLQFLSTEFEELVLTPVTALKGSPVAALRRMVELYLDPEIASSRKVSVWYSFWGEASSRQEYYDICGQKDERFANLVRLLIERLIADTGQSHLDPDAIALGLIGVLEVLWQDIAFQTETSIDRRAAKQRAMAYLRSVFPGQFAAGGAAPIARRTGDAAVPFEMNGRASGHEAQIPAPGDFLTLETASERILLLRDAAGAVRAWRIARGSS